MTNVTRYDNEEVLKIRESINLFSKLENYRVIEHISSGFEGSVFNCQCDLFLNNKIQTTQVAIKMLFNDGRSTGSFTERHENEYQILKSISHNNIVNIFTYFNDKPTEVMISMLPEEIKKINGIKF